MAAAAGTGSVSGLLLHLLVKAASEVPAPGLDICPACLDLPEGLDLRSLGIGIFIGLLIGPGIEVLYWLQLCWRRAIYRWLSGVLRPPLVLYNVHEQ